MQTVQWGEVTLTTKLVWGLMQEPFCAKLWVLKMEKETLLQKVFWESSRKGVPNNYL